MLPFAFLDHGGQQQQPLPLRVSHDLVDHLTDGLCMQRDVMVRTARFAHPGKQQAQVVVYLGNGADRGTGVVGSGFLFD